MTESFEQPPEDNEPQDYDGYVDYVCGRAPGVDGVTYADGSRTADHDTDSVA